MSSLETLKRGLESGDVVAKNYLREIKLMRAREEIDEREYLNAREFFQQFARKRDAHMSGLTMSAGEVTFPSRVIVTDLKVPFWSVVVLVLKFAIAAIPAAIMIGLAWAAVTALILA